MTGRSHTGKAQAAGKGALKSAGAAGDGQVSKLPREVGRKAPNKAGPAGSIYTRTETICFHLKQLACVFLVQLDL